jgi:2-polyprenyl-6-methoxyphenol hydroxylase-like FAD-dependent oxidoreductase
LNAALPERADVVMIGAGMGGLTSAALLAKAGLDVCVIEMDARPGGQIMKRASTFSPWSRLDTVKAMRTEFRSLALESFGGRPVFRLRVERIDPDGKQVAGAQAILRNSADREFHIPWAGRVALL